MSQQGFQTQLLYGSLVSGAVPPASQLVTNASGVELAINAADGRLFYKDTAGNVRILADVNVQGAQGIANITGGAINNTTIGATTPSTGNFTTITTGSLTVPALVGIVKSNGNAGFSVAVPGTDYVPGSSVGTANGVASLDASGKVPLSQLPDAGTGGLTYLGSWNASTNTPNLVSGVGTKGYFYKVSVAGTTNLDGTSAWSIGDQVIFNGIKWERIAESSAPVLSVNGLTGQVTITRNDLGAAASGANFDITSLSGLTTSISVAQGGTGVTTISGLIKGNGNSAFTPASAGIDYAAPTTGNNAQLLANNGSGGFSNVTLGAGLTYQGGVLSSTGGGSGSGSVTSVNVAGGTTGLTFGGGPITTAGVITMSGTLAVAHGGTGRATLNGMLKGAGTSGIVSAVVGVDYAPATNGGVAQLLANNGTGGFTNVTLGAGLLYSGGTLSAPGGGAGGSGTVTSVDVSGGSTGLVVTGGPITANGVLTIGGRLGVPSGGTGVASIVGLVRGNGAAAFSPAVPSVDYAVPPSGSVAQLLSNNGTGGFSNVTVGTGLLFSGGILTATSTGGGVGTVTSVNVSGGTTGLAFSGGPITTAGTVTMSGTLSVSSGGTGLSTISGLLKGNGASPMSAAVPGTDYAPATTGTSAQMLAANGSGGFSPVTIGTGLSLFSGTLSSTVTSTIPDGSLLDVKIAANAAIQSTKLSYTAVGSSAVARTVSSRLNDFLMVKDFGAVGDGSANDSIAVAAAISAASTAGKALVFSDGNYSIPSLSIISGRVLLVGMGNVTVKGTLSYQATLPEAADTLTPLTPSSAFFSATGINFQSTTSDYALKIVVPEQSKYLSTFTINECKFFGDKGLLAQNAIGFEVVGCEFNNITVGTQLEGCVDGVLSQTRWQNQAAVGLRVTNTTNHGAGGTDRRGGKALKISMCEFVYCTVGLHADKTIGLTVSSTTVDFCATPIYLTGALGTKLLGVTANASLAPVTRFSGLAGYVAPPTQGTAVYGRPGGYAGGDMSIGLSATGCEFQNSVAGSTTPVVLIDGYLNATYPQAAARISFYDCQISQEVAHSAATLLYISRATVVRVVGNKFQSPNLGTAMVDAWRAENCTSSTGIINDFTFCTQTSVTVGSSYERRVNTTFVQATEPTFGVIPGDTWVQP